MSGGARSRLQGAVYRRHPSDQNRRLLIRYLIGDTKYLNPIDALENRERARELSMEGILSRERQLVQVHRIFFERRGKRVYALRDQKGRFAK